MKLHDYYRSSAAYRVRIALNIKGLSYTQISHHLRHGEQRAADYLALNPQGLIPALELTSTLENDNALISQSLAIIEYLEEIHPTPALLPRDPLARAQVRSLALAIACDLHPLNNLRVLNHLSTALGHDQATRTEWILHWLGEELGALEKKLAQDANAYRFCHGDQPTLADVCLIPQLYNARRFHFDLSAYPTLVRIDEACLALPAFATAVPEQQADAE